MSHACHRSIALTLGLLLATVLTLAACATNPGVAMSPEDRNALKSAPVVYVVRYAPGYMNMMTPNTAVGTGGLLASSIKRSTGSTELPTWRELERTYALPDAAEELSSQLVQKLKAEGALNLRVEPKALPLPASEEASAYRGKYANGLLLELTVPGRSAMYGPMSWKTYYYGLHGKARLIRLADSKVLWADTCNIGDRSDAALTFDVSEFEANNGARLKQMIRYSSDRCSRVLADKLLGKAS